VRLSVRGEADVTRVILEAKRLAKEAGFDDTAAGKLATAVSELARNIIKYAKRGDVTITRLEASTRIGMEVVVRDTGPGIPDIEQAMTDSFSSSGTLGLGLPGVRRLMDEFSIESEVGRGTKVRICKWETR
jgi:serine/threonine-protein kinase RsbT